jgi:hypothetical protein
VHKSVTATMCRDLHRASSFLPASWGICRAFGSEGRRGSVRKKMQLPRNSKNHSFGGCVAWARLLPFAQTLRCGAWEKEGGLMRRTGLWAGGARVITLGVAAALADNRCPIAPGQEKSVFSFLALLFFQKKPPNQNASGYPKVQARDCGDPVVPTFDWSVDDHGR